MIAYNDINPKVLKLNFFCLFINKNYEHLIFMII